MTGVSVSLIRRIAAVPLPAIVELRRQGEGISALPTRMIS